MGAGMEAMGLVCKKRENLVKILFVYQALSTFVKKDLNTLRSAHTVRECHFRGINDIPKLWSGVKWCDVTFSWFGKLHAFFTVLFSKILGKKSAVIAGGDDATKYVVGGKRYGLFAHPIKRWFVYFVFRYADLVLPVSKFILNELFLYSKVDSEKTKLIYHGFDSDLYKRSPCINRNNMVVTIGDVCWENFYRKGHRLIIETATFLPHLQFAIIGPWLDDSISELKRIAPQNVTFTEGLYDKPLIEYLSQASVYIQVSEWESFGCALAEAMLCECTPVVTTTTAIPEVVGNCGFYIDKLEPKELAEKIQLALQNPQIGKMARERIIKMFPLERRREELLKAISLLGD